jgi:Protein of unknown function (DUF2939)
MKWAAAILAAMLYIASPYYTLVELNQALQTVDTAALRRLVDWDRVRSSLKMQLQERLNERPKTAAEAEYVRRNPVLAAAGNAIAQTFANSVIDSFATPEGLARLIQGARDAGNTTRSTQPVRLDQNAANRNATQQSFWKRLGFAFFISPIDFELDLKDPDDAGSGGAAARRRPRITVMLTFKVTGWQVSDVRVRD